jgi:predicted lipoprotein with Yx(FWY)xxD motif
MPLVRLVSVIALACALATGCSGGAPAATKPVVAPVGHVILRVGATRTQPAVLIDQRGDTLYVSSREAANRQSCTGQCLQVWPLVLLRRGGSADAGADAIARTAITTVPVTGGDAVAYHGFLLHTYVGDPSPGGDAGQGVNGQWSTITPAGRRTA